jgi:multiple sugar transport system substrate-binding protein
MCFGGPDVWSEIQSGDASAGVNIAASDVGVAIVPGIQPGTSGTINGFEGLGINKFSKQKQAALHFINYMTSPDVQKKIMLELGKDSLPSSRQSVLNDPGVQSQYPIAGDLAKQGSYTALRYSAPFDLSPAFDSAIRDMFGGNATPQQARDECVMQCEQIIAKYLSA